MGEFEKRIYNLYDKINRDFEDAYCKPATLKHDIKPLKEVTSSILDEARKEFPWKELNFFDPRDTREAEDFRKNVYDWYKKWFGDGKV